MDWETFYKSFQEIWDIYDAATTLKNNNMLGARATVDVVIANLNQKVQALGSTLTTSISN